MLGAARVGRATGRSGTTKPRNFTTFVDQTGRGSVMGRLKRVSLLIAALFAWTGFCAPQNQAQDDSQSVYKARCAQCHDGEKPFPTREGMKDMAPDYVLQVMTAGPMQPMALGLTSAQKLSLAEFLSGKKAVNESSQGMCSATPIAKASGPDWNGWGLDSANSRFQSSPGLTAADLPKLRVTWAFGFPGVASAYSQPTVVNGRVYVGSSEGKVYALDAKTGCTIWVFQAERGVRASIVLGPDNVAYFGDTGANAYAVNAETGKQVWKVKVDDYLTARVTGGPKLYDGKLYVPISSRDEWFASAGPYSCCRFRGSVVALDAATGKQIWKTYTIPDPATKMTTSDGSQAWGPSGSGVWTSPTIDAQKGVFYVGTGDGYTGSSQPLSDSVLAISLSDGNIVWSHQFTKDDAFTSSCLASTPTYCSKTPGPDFDVSASPILHTDANGRRILLVGQKSGTLFAVDPDDRGKVLWQASLGKGGYIGGIQWGIAADNDAVFAPISDMNLLPGAGGPTLEPKVGGGLHALQISDGKRVWDAKPPSGTCAAGGCSPGQSAAITAIPGAVLSGAVDGHLRAYSTEDGSVLWDLDTAIAYETVNHVTAHGGSLDGPGPVIADGMLFLNSGYSMWSERPGNVLIAFSVR
jgi:polyvinyl alcohol dehydrogenase (cytochrome)